MNEANMGNFEVTRGVADWSVAATRIPTKHALYIEGHACEGLQSMGESDVLGKGCDNVRSSQLVQDVAGFA